MPGSGANTLDLGDAILSRTDALAACSESPDRLARAYLTPAHRQANDLVLGWMRQAGMAARQDAAGNVVGRYEGKTPGLPALAIGSHLDTVRNAGRYDGMLGVVTAIACVEALAGERFDFAIEVIGFANEEGARFGSALTGSRAVAGTLNLSSLDSRDRQDITMANAMREFGLDPSRIAEAKRPADEIAAYVEVHIEQGPVLEDAGLALGAVTAIAGATRVQADLRGMAGHAGTTPMTLRRDALAGAAEAVLLVEKRCGETPGLVGTVGRIEAAPGAVNVIPGHVGFTMDIRAEHDADRQSAVSDVLFELRELAERRGLDLEVKTLHENPSTPCGERLIALFEDAIAAQGATAKRLPSGAGHDAMAMAAIAEIGMLFVRCKGGISHNPAESITAADSALAANALLSFIRSFRPDGR